jgi:F-type H+-transporting ATPase subunit gamma
MADQQGIEEIRARLNNIRSVEPILGAMRTISLGSWQGALNRQARVRDFSRRLAALIPVLTPHLDLRVRGRHKRGYGAGGPAYRRGLFHRGAARPAASQASIAVLVIGSERGLCGAFNSTLIEYVRGVLDDDQARGTSFELAALGARAVRALERDGRDLAWSRALPMTMLPSSELAAELVQGWLARYERYELDAVEVIYNAYQSSTVYRSQVARLIPPPMPPLTAESAPWPPSYVDTPPLTLYARLITLWATAEMYRILLDSAAAEHSARFQLMEGATQNSNRLVSELTLALQAARQHAITTEMQELAAGAGLVGGTE